MLSVKFVLKNPDLVKQACRDKQLNDQVVDKFIASNRKRRALITQTEELRKAINQNAEKIKQQVSQGLTPDSTLIENGKNLKNQLKELEPQLKQAEQEFTQYSLQLPNIPAPDVPIGQDESFNQVVEQVGEKPKFDFEPLPHQELMEKLDWLDTKKANMIGGFRTYFLKNQAVILEQALLNYGLKIMIEQGFTPLTAPVLVNENAMWGTGYFPWGQDDHYRTQDKNILAGTAEVALTAFYQGQILRERDLPIKMVGISPCFRREVGSYGKDTKGIIRVHQFNKVEQVVYTVADEQETITWHQKMVGFAKKLLNDLRLPYQVLLMCTGDMGAGQRKKYDIETWFPAQKKYRETHSASYFNDFQARRLNIRYQAKDGSLKYVYTLNNTVVASTRLLAAIVENFQQADGSIKTPKVLLPWIGKEILSKNN